MLMDVTTLLLRHVFVELICSFEMQIKARNTKAGIVVVVVFFFFFFFRKKTL